MNARARLASIAAACDTVRDEINSTTRKIRAAREEDEAAPADTPLLVVTSRVGLGVLVTFAALFTYYVHKLITVNHSDLSHTEATES